MKQQRRSWQVVARVLVLALAIAAAPMVVLAAEPGPTPPAAPALKASIAKATTGVTLAKARAQGSDKSDRSALGSTSFFKKPVGIAVLAVFIGGTGYAVYSATHDRIHSVVRAGK